MLGEGAVALGLLFVYLVPAILLMGWIVVIWQGKQLFGTSNRKKMAVLAISIVFLVPATLMWIEHLAPSFMEIFEEKREIANAPVFHLKVDSNHSGIYTIYFKTSPEGIKPENGPHQIKINEKGEGYITLTHLAQIPFFKYELNGESLYKDESQHSNREARVVLRRETGE